MINKLQIIISLVLVLLLLGSLPAMARRDKVNFRHKTSGTLKTKCQATKNSNDFFVTYKCYENDSFQSFEPGAEWEQVEVQKVCLLHVEGDRVSSCLKITDRAMVGQVFICLGRKEPVLVRPSAKWREMSSTDKRCAPLLAVEDVPRTIVFPSLSMQGEKNGPQN